MAAFEASLSGLSLDFAEETSSDAPETETSAESTEEPETEEDITGSEAAPVIEMEYPEETEETEPEIEDLDATRVIPDVTSRMHGMRHREIHRNLIWKKNSKLL